MSAALERRRIAKRQAAARAERKRKAAISIALNEKRKEKLKVRRPCAFSGKRVVWCPVSDVPETTAPPANSGFKSAAPQSAF